MKQPPKATGRRGRKVSVEIYFVLYLSAIVLLLGTAHTAKTQHDDPLEEAVMQLLAPDFRVGADRSVMIYRFVPPGTPASTNMPPLRRDSINVIRAVGSFSDVRFALVAIEDTSTGSALPLDNAILTRQDDRTAIFSWRPRTVRENAVYRVTVRATATPLPPSSVVRPDIRAKIAEVLRRRGTISDSVSFTVNVFALTNPVLLASAGIGTDTSNGAGTGPAGSGELGQQGMQTSSIGAPFGLTPSQPIVFVSARGVWRNRININGSADDLDLQITPPGVRITDRSPLSIELSGMAPSSGEQQVVVNGTRRGDHRSVRAQFVINTAPIEAMKVPETFWAGQSYSLDFKSANVPTDQIRVEIIENDRVVVKRSEGGAVVNYHPASAGKASFVRYVGDNAVDRTTVSIAPLPPPITQPKRLNASPGEVIVQTTSYGVVKGEPNHAQLKILDGNAYDPEELTQRYEYDPVTLAHTQYWRVRWNGKGDFVFRAYALDRRGSNGGKSTVINVEGDAK